MKITDFSIKYGDKLIFDNFSIDFEKGSVTAILGPSGVGKTTLLNAVAGLLSCEGRIGDVGRVSYMFQEARLIDSLTVKENLLYVIGGKKATQEARKRLEDLIEAVGLKGEEDSFPTELSGGMASRVSLARAFLTDSDTLLMDEPLRSLDTAIKLKLIEEIKALLKVYPRTVLLVTHDAREGIALADRIIAIKGSPVRVVIDEAVNKNMSEDDKSSLEKRLIQAIS